MLPPTHFDFAAQEQLVDFRCARCGHGAQAWVQGGGFALEVGGVSVSNARLDAQHGAARAVALARCPRCGHRGRSALARVAALGVVVGALAGPAAYLQVAERLHASRSDGAIALQAGLATFLVATAATISLKLRSISRRVRFVRP